MRYLGGKYRQSKQIVAALEASFKNYVEPFCGGLWSATAVMKKFPDAYYILNDNNPFLIRFWQEAGRGWNPPEFVSKETYDWYKSHRPKDDPMTAYVGFGWSFAGKFFGSYDSWQGTYVDKFGRSRSYKNGSYRSTVNKIKTLRSVSYEISCTDYQNVYIPKGSVVYLDPPYSDKTPQSTLTAFDGVTYLEWASWLVKERQAFVLASEMTNPGWKVLYDWGDTTVVHGARKKQKDHELLMQVT